MKRFRDYLALFITTGLFSGFLPGKINKEWMGEGGGLMGSFFGLAIMFFIIVTDASQSFFYCLLYGLLAFGYIFVGYGEKMMLELYGYREKYSGPMKQKILTAEDYNETNIDEVVGQMIAASWLIFIHQNLCNIILGLVLSFIAFRILDATKILGIRKFEKSLNNFDSNLSIMADDVLAGLYAAIFSILIFAIIGMFT